MMKRSLRVLWCVLVVLLLAGLTSCSWKREPDWVIKGHTPQWLYEQEAIRLHVRADSQLHLYNGEPHTLYVCVYQLRNPNAFNQVINSDRIFELLSDNCTFQDGSVAGSLPLTIRPADDLLFPMDRAEGAKYVAVVAGYSELMKEKVTRLMEIPVLVKRKGFSHVSKPGRLNIYLELGPHDIRTIREE